MAPLRSPSNSVRVSSEGLDRVVSWPGELAEPEQLVGHLDELWDVLRDGPDRFVSPERIVEFAAASIPHAEHCGLSVSRANRPPQSLGSSGPLPATVDALQHTIGEGPCLDSLRDDRLTQVDDLEADARWPRFAERCIAETGVVSVLSVPLTLGGRDQAALNLYATTSHVFEERDAALGSIVAPFAALSIQQALRERDASDFEEALSSSRQIGTAVGILMARESVTSEQAFELLRSASNHLNQKVRQIAALVELTGELPVIPAGRSAKRSPRRKS
jgi:GAF domain-containing protein